MAEPFTLALSASVRIASVGLGLTALELAAGRHVFAPGGPFSVAAFTSAKGRPPPAWLGEARPVAVVAILQAMAAAVLVVFGPLSIGGRLALVFTLTTALGLRWRRGLVGDGAEQLTIITLVAATLALVPVADDARIRLAVLLVAAQVILAYVTAGTAKLVSPVWRQGNAVGEILGTFTHGHARSAGVLARWPNAGRVLGWSVIALELLFPLALFGPTWLAVVALVAGLSFHIGCAWLMGLNSFLWAFPATYPCVLATRHFLVT